MHERRVKSFLHHFILVHLGPEHRHRLLQGKTNNTLNPFYLHLTN